MMIGFEFVYICLFLKVFGDMVQEIYDLHIHEKQICLLPAPLVNISMKKC